VGGGDAVTLRAVYLDRDGVINRAVVRGGRPYPPATPEEVEILPGVPQALARLRAAGFRLVVVTNQPDVGRGATPRETVEAIHAAMARSLPLDAIHACFHAGTEGCGCRKPRPGMLLQDGGQHGVDMRRSFMVGDRWRDVDAGAAAGCRTVLIDEGYDERAPDNAPDHICRSLGQAADWILGVSDEAPR
jgi:D-glycero-D-manno-heptose 1,7-bisphosphate phosphatase